MYLAIYDLSGIQKFIFSTNKLKEIIGASIIVNRALFENLPELLNEECHEWENRKFGFTDRDIHKIIYIGGGNALVMYNCKETEQRVTRELACRVFQQSGGAIRLCSASIELNENETLSENQKRLMELLDIEKKSAGIAVTSRGISINAHDNAAYEPIVLIDDKYYAPRSLYCKNEASKDSEKMFRDLTEKEMSIAALFDNPYRNSKNYLAIIHIDGNTMGIRIRNFVEKQQGNVIEALNKLKDLSKSINSLYKNVLKETINEVFEGQTNIPFRPIVVDGDDITLICESYDALKIVGAFMSNLAEMGKDVFGDGTPPTAAAGIAFVKARFPFSIAYELAESCCKNAKAKTLESERNEGRSQCKSSMDFQVCYSGITSDMNTFRKRHYNIDGKILIKRPYIFGTSDKGKDYQEFIKLAEFLYEGIKLNNIARSKLKELRSAYVTGSREAKNYGQYILAHVEGCIEDKNNKELEIAEMLSDPFDENGRARFFDCLDLMDIIWREESDDDRKNED